jgi:hypothetical protein
MKKKINPDLDNLYRSLKKDLRRAQRKDQYLKELKEIDNLDRMAKRKNKNAFWRYTSNLKKKRTELKEINIPIDQLIDHYKKLFYVDDSNLNHKQTEISQKVLHRINE